MLGVEVNRNEDGSNEPFNHLNFENSGPIGNENTAEFDEGIIKACNLHLD